jgi:hypothetical protein
VKGIEQSRIITAYTQKRGVSIELLPELRPV